MAKALFINRTEAELLVDVLEDNYKTAKHKPHGVGADLANEVRDLFGMLHKESDINETVVLPVAVGCGTVFTNKLSMELVESRIKKDIEDTIYSCIKKAADTQKQ